MPQDEKRFIAIEMMLAEQERILEDLNQVIIEQGRHIEKLQKQNAYLMAQIKNDTVKSEDEETPPPHY